MSTSVQATRASSRNHNHTRTPVQGRPANARAQPTNTHNPHSNQNIAHRLDMHLPPTPPAERLGAHSDGDSKRGSSGGSDPPTTPNASPRPSKFGASPSAPSFASVVSASSTTRVSAKSPLSTTPTSSLQQHIQQTQEHAHSSAAPLSLELLSKTNDDGNNTIGDNTTTAADSSSGTLSSSPRYHSPLGSSLMPKGSNNTTFSVNTNNNTNSPASATDAEDAEQDQENDNEDSESSDVEIYLNTLGLHDSAARMHVFVGPGTTEPNSNSAQVRSSPNGLIQMQPSNESPVIPSMAQFLGNATHSNTHTLQVGATQLNNTKSLSPLSFALPCSSTSPSSHQHSVQFPSNGNGNGNGQIGQAKSPQLPAAPVQGTIPLPHLDNEYIQDADARQLQNLQQHQQMHSQPTAHSNGTIDLAGLTIGGGMNEVRGQSQQQQEQLGLPTSHSQPVLTIDHPFDHFQDDIGLRPASNFPTSVSDSSGLGGAGQKTPNVYINGLPPHFREDQLFDLACPFGAIRSVRTFTRHVRDSESGYGFVLFETIEAAERCIVSLRRYRNLHPTFSKQIHKIPGTTYAQGAMASSSTSTWNESFGSESGSNGGSNEGSLGAEASFKAKMESLQDPTSTNLYMEGLPLSIDEPTLSALVAPHVISSSRFFHTRLSNPPRIIAFVRLETRKGAEEIIERLHGRMVRGWNDTGSRISVRFADTSEQRELRRTERSTQEGDGSPARLTIAQAALLNLRGNELGPESTGPVIHACGPGIGRLSSVSSRGFSTSASAPDFASNAHLFPSTNELAVDYSLAPGRGMMVTPGSRSKSPYETQQDMGYHSDSYATQVQVGYNQTPSTPMDPAMAALLTSLNNTNLSYQSAAGGYENTVSADLDYTQGQRAGHVPQYAPVGQYNLPTSQSLDDIHQYTRPAPVYTRSGYTPTEEYIMRAHAESAALVHAQAQAQAQQQQSERRRPAPLDLRRRRGEDGQDDAAPANIAVGVRGYRMQASVGRIGQGLMSPSTSMGSLASPSMGMGMNLMAEGDFHQPTMNGRNDFRQHLNNSEGEVNRAVGSAAHTRHNPNIHPAHVNARLSRDPPPSAPSVLTSYSQTQRSPLPLSPPSPPCAQASNQDSPNLNQPINYQHAAAHLRSTTLPQHRTSSARDGQQMVNARGHYQHNSMSMPAQNLRTPQHASVAAFCGAGGVEVNGGTIYEDSSREDEQQQQQKQRLDARLNSVNSSNGSSAIGSSGSESVNSASSQLAPKSHYSPSGQNIFGDMESSSSTSSLISPTLTYGTQTPSTLSPATPFFGSFSSQSDGFDKDGQQKKQVNVGTAVSHASLRA